MIALVIVVGIAMFALGVLVGSSRTQNIYDIGYRDGRNNTGPRSMNSLY